MSNENIISDIKVQLNEINKKVDEIRGKVDDNKDAGINVQANAMLKKLETLKDEITVEFNKLQRAEGKKQDNVPSSDKNIYNSIKSFNEAFSEAGAMFKPR